MMKKAVKKKKVSKKVKSKNKGIKFTAGLITGAVVGAVAGILLAPKKGKEMRKDLRKNAEKIAKDVSKKIAKLESVTKPRYEKVVDDVVSLYEKAKKISEKELKEISVYLKKKWPEVEKKIKGYMKNNKKK